MAPLTQHGKPRDRKQNGGCQEPEAGGWERLLAEVEFRVTERLGVGQGYCSVVGLC